MKFIDRHHEMERLDRLAARKEGGLVVVYGRRRIGKTRLLLEWVRKHGGLYTVADQSAPEIQRRYLAEAVAERIPGFGGVLYPDWRALLDRLAREARLLGWRGPIVLDELPYLVAASPELPSVLQRWVEHEAREAGLSIALAGSARRMMQGLVLSGAAPLYGRAAEILELAPLAAGLIPEAFGRQDGCGLIQTYAAWGGIPRYWELAAALEGPTTERIEHLVLDPLGPLHREPDRLLLEELPPAVELRPVLDAIGAGAHRVSEIAARMGRPATSMSRPLERLVGMGLARREVPFGESEKESRKSLYKLADPFFRLWFRVVAPHRAQLASGLRPARLQLLERHWDGLAAQAWEELCRDSVPRLSSRTDLGSRGPWGPASRWWKGQMPEWDVVSLSVDGKRLMLGEVKWGARPFHRKALEQAARELAGREAPPLGSRYSRCEVFRVLFVPQAAAAALSAGSEVHVTTASELVEIPEPLTGS